MILKSCLILLGQQWVGLERATVARVAIEALTITPVVTVPVLLFGAQTYIPLVGGPAVCLQRAVVLHAVVHHAIAEGVNHKEVLRTTLQTGHLEPVGHLLHISGRRLSAVECFLLGDKSGVAVGIGGAASGWCQRIVVIACGKQYGCQHKQDFLHHIVLVHPEPSGVKNGKRCRYMRMYPHLCLYAFPHGPMARVRGITSLNERNGS